MFLLFALITLAGAVAMLLQKNVIVAGLCMVLTFFGVAGLFVLLANPVAAALQIIVYSGAIMVLVLFTIMLLNSHEEEPAETARPIQRGGSVGLVAVLAAGALVLISRSGLLAKLDAGSRLPVKAMTLEQVGGALFTGHLLAFEVVGLLLLAAMVGAVALTKRDL
jgi:NADH-quinone oxidoreductase subunit J